MSQKQYASVNTRNKSNLDNPENWPSLSYSNTRISPRLKPSYDKFSGARKKKQNAYSQSNCNDQLDITIRESNEITLNSDTEAFKNVQLSMNTSGLNKSDNVTETFNKPTSRSSKISSGHVTTPDKKCNNKNTDNSNDNNKIEEMKQSRKLNRKLAKEEKQRKREEELRRCKIVPKSEHFRIVDSEFKKLFDSVSRGTNRRGEDNDGAKGLLSRNDKHIDSGFQLERNLGEFPDLQSSGKLKYESDKKNKKHNQQICDVQRSHTHVQFSESSKDLMSVGVRNGMELLSNGSNLNPSQDTTASKTKKRIKRNTPIEFNLINALQLIKAKDTRHHMKQVRRNLKSTNVSAKKNTLCGNKLDSDNPVRRKGKYRENKKKKYTLLKKCLINERILRKSLINSANKMLESDKTLRLDNGLDKSLFFRLTNYKTSISLDEEQSTSNYEKKDVDKNVEVIANSVNPRILIHTRKFRSYCDHWPCKEMQNEVCNLIRTVLKFQDRAYANDPIKAHAKRRYVCGFHEAMRFLRVNKVKLMIIATDLECANGEGGGSLIECVKQLTTTAEALGVPYVYSGTRWSIKAAFKKTRPISCAAILNYEGAEEMFKSIISMLPQVKNTYIEKLKAAEIECGIRNDIKEDAADKCIRSMLDRLAINDCDDRITLSESTSSILDTTKITEEIEDESPFMTAILKCTTK